MTSRKTLLRPLAALLLVQFGLAPLHAYAQVAELDIQRNITQKASVQMAAYQLATLASNLDSDAYQETPAMAAGAGPADGGVIPDGYGLPRTDGYGAYLGYCAWDNGASTGLAGHIPGGVGQNKPVFAVLSYGLDNTFQTTCADIASTGTAKGDDYVYFFTVGQATFASGNNNVLGSQYWRDPVATTAALNALDTSILINGEIRLVQADGSLWRFNGTAWVGINAGGVSSDASGNAIIGKKAAIGQATIGTEQLFVNGGGAAALGLQSTGATTGTNLYNSTGALAGFMGNDNTNGTMLFNAIGQPIVFQVSGVERFRIGADGSLSQNGTVFLDATRNLVNIVNGTFSGLVSAGSFNASTAYEMGGVTVIDSSRNATFNGLTATGSATIDGTLAVSGQLQANGGLTATNITATGALTANSITAATINAGTITASGLLAANGGIATTMLSSSGQISFTGNYGGTAASPALAFTGSNYTGGTGLYSPGGNMLGFATAGQARLTVDAAGKVTIAAVAVGTALDVGSDMAVNGVRVGRGSGNIATNTAFGTNALGANTTGADNVAMGYSALPSNTAGSGNVAIGSGAGAGLLGGDNNTFLGAGAGLTTAGSFTNATAIGAGAKVNSNNTIVLGRPVDTTVIGTDAASGSTARLQITGGVQLLAMANPAGANGMLNFDSGTSKLAVYQEGAWKTVATTDQVVSSLTGTPNQIIVSGSTGSVVISLPQDIHTSATPTFAGVTITGPGMFSGMVSANGGLTTTTLTATGAAALANLTASTTSLTSTLTVAGDTTLNGKLTVAGDTTLNGALLVKKALTAKSEILLATMDSAGTTVQVGHACPATGAIATDGTDVVICK